MKSSSRSAMLSQGLVLSGPDWAFSLIPSQLHSLSHTTHWQAPILQMRGPRHPFYICLSSGAVRIKQHLECWPKGSVPCVWLMSMSHPPATLSVPMSGHCELCLQNGRAADYRERSWSRRGQACGSVVHNVCALRRILPVSRLQCSLCEMRSQDY